MVDFAGSHVVVTGGPGALGRAVIGALRAANAVCHIPNLIAAELDGFPYATDAGVHIVRGIDVADEAAVKRFYDALPPPLLRFARARHRLAGLRAAVSSTSRPGPRSSRGSGRG